MSPQKSQRNSRKGATTVEFALVAPIVLLTVFAIIETSRLMLMEGNVNSAMLVGMRQASIVSSTSDEVTDIIRAELDQSGITSASIEVRLQDTGSTISISAPLNTANGFVGTRVVAPNSKIDKSIEFDREP